MSSRLLPPRAAVSTASWPGQEGPVHIGDQETRGEDVLPHQRKDREERTQEKDPGFLKFMSLGKSSLLRFSSSKVCPSGPGQMVTGAASAVLWDPGQPDNNQTHTHTDTHTHTHIHTRHRGYWLAGSRWRVSSATLSWQGLAELDVQARDSEASS